MSDYERLGSFYLGREYDLERKSLTDALTLYDSKDLTTHAVCVGMTGSGKTGLCLSLLEEAAIDGVPVIAIDPKGDIGNLLLTFPDLAPANFRPWIDEDEALRNGVTPDEHAVRVARQWRDGLADWDQSGERIARLKNAAEFSIYTPGSNAGLPLTVLRSFSAPPAAILQDSDALRERISAAVSGVLTLLGIEADPIRSREHILLSHIVGNQWMSGQDVNLGQLIRLIQTPGFDKIGFMDLDLVFPPEDRVKLSMQLNNLLASPGFSAWMQGEPLDIGRMLMTAAGKPRVSILSIAHLTDAERMFFVTIFLNELLTWVRSQAGTSSLRAIFYMDEVFGYFPPSANPPSKQPMLTLLKQARAFGVGCVLATQNPVDLDYKGLSNTGTWFLGRLQTERDKLRVLDGLEGASAAAGSEFDRASMERILSALGKRVFLMHNVHESQPVIFQTRWALSYLRGPLQRSHITKLMEQQRAAVPLSAPTFMPSQETGPRTTSRAAPATSAGHVGDEAGGFPPLVPEHVSQRILALQRPLPQGARLVYRTGLYALSRARYVDTKSRIDLWRDLTLLSPLTAPPAADVWLEADEVEGRELGFDAEFEPHAEFDDVPAELQKSRTMTSWQTQLKNHIYREHPLALWFSSKPKLYSEPGETEAMFRMRVFQVLREERDLEREKVRVKFSKLLPKEEADVRAAEERVNRESAQAQQESLSTAVSFGTSILGAVFGRKLSSRTNVTAAGRAIQGAGRVSRSRQDVNSAEAKLQTERQELEECEAQYAREYAALELTMTPEELPVEAYTVSPRKSDIQVTEVCLAWLPWAIDAKGQAYPLYLAR